MKTFTNQALAVFAISSLVQAHPQGGFHSTSANPALVTKRKLYNLDQISDQDQKDKLTQGLKDAVTIAAKVLEKMDDSAHESKWEYWFGPKSDSESREKIRNVFKNFVGDNKDGTGADINGDVLVFPDDYWTPSKKEIGDGNTDGNTPFCSIDINGKTGTAYYKPTQDKKPGMHYCDKVWDRKNLKTLLEDNCKALGNHISTVLWTKQFIGANVLHEFMHYPKVGKKAVDELIRDYKYDAWQCRYMSSNSDKSPIDMKGRKWEELTIVNADTYVWYALDIAFEELCQKKFSGPRSEKDDDQTNQDWPDENIPGEK
ncbi:unnamed protein product [Periconia digitata]|uniref:Uncharacterized protein n=1 Tax=Periconia digitata TaxID=1303443 RepID=A0A9W4U5X1_9PLEO|nr:unnamed protein product [Periconia digitata]